MSEDPRPAVRGKSALFYNLLRDNNSMFERIYAERIPLIEEIRVGKCLQFPELRLIEYDCGKDTRGLRQKNLFFRKHRS